MQVARLVKERNGLKQVEKCRGQIVKPHSLLLPERCPKIWPLKVHDK
jgi:hypothetical protein